MLLDADVVHMRPLTEAEVLKSSVVMVLMEESNTSQNEDPADLF